MIKLIHLSRLKLTLSRYTFIILKLLNHFSHIIQQSLVLIIFNKRPKVHIVGKDKNS
jgi:hypothetical protein